MAGGDTELKIRITADSAEAKNAIVSLSDTGVAKISTLAGAFAKVGSMVADAAMRLVGSIGDFFKSSLGAAMDAERSVNNLRQALESAGVSYGQVSGRIEEMLASLQRSTKFGDEDYRDALARMVRATGDVEGSIKNLALVADIAVGRNIDLASAADIVAKVMGGQRTALRSLGMVLPENVDMVEALRSSFAGLANEEGQTLQGKLAIVKNLFGEFKEAVGAALLGTGELGGGLDLVANALSTVTTWIAERAAPAMREWLGRARELVQPVIDIFVALAQVIGPTLGDAFGLLGRVAGAVFEQLRQGVLLVLTGAQAILSGLIDLLSAVWDKIADVLEAAGRLAKRLGIDWVSDAANAVRELQERMERASQELQQKALANAQRWRERMTGTVREGTKEIVDTVTEGEARVTRTVTLESLKRQARIEDEQKAYREQLKKTFKSVEDAIEDALKAITRHTDKESTKWQAAIDVFAKQTKPPVDSVEATFKSAMAAITGYLKDAKDAIPEAELAQMRNRVSELNAAFQSGDPLVRATAASIALIYKQHLPGIIEGLKAENEKREEIKAKTDAQVARDRERRQLAIDLVRSTIDLANAFGAVSDNTAAVLDDIMNMAQGISRIMAGDLTGIMGVIGGLTSLVSRITRGDTAAQREAMRAWQSVADAALKLNDTMRMGASGRAIAGARDILGALLFAPGENPLAPQTGTPEQLMLRMGERLQQQGIEFGREAARVIELIRTGQQPTGAALAVLMTEIQRGIQAQLATRGVSGQEFQQLLKDLGLETGWNAVAWETRLNAMQVLLRQLSNLPFGPRGTDPLERLASMQALWEAEGLTSGERLSQLQALMRELAPQLDVGSRESVLEIFRQLMTGTLPAGRAGALSASALQRFLEELLRLMPGEGGAGAASAAAAALGAAMRIGLGGEGIIGGGAIGDIVEGLLPGIGEGGSSLGSMLGDITTGIGPRGSALETLLGARAPGTTTTTMGGVVLNIAELHLGDFAIQAADDPNETARIVIEEVARALGRDLTLALRSQGVRI